MAFPFWALIGFVAYLLVIFQYNHLCSQTLCLTKEELIWEISESEGKDVGSSLGKNPKGF
ncbi:hypothetical protein BYT27DRAFT_7202823 [Phlegmacium glaucopus]|nr:hypothetical protein BYT27DRAFT_7202823 [Phlegmacium glaucopus]